MSQSQTSCTEMTQVQDTTDLMSLIDSLGEEGFEPSACVLDPEDLSSAIRTHVPDPDVLTELTTDQPINRKRRHDELELADLDAFVLPKRYRVALSPVPSSSYSLVSLMLSPVPSSSYSMFSPVDVESDDDDVSVLSSPGSVASVLSSPGSVASESDYFSTDTGYSTDTDRPSVGSPSPQSRVRRRLFGHPTQTYQNRQIVAQSRRRLEEFSSSHVHHTLDLFASSADLFAFPDDLDFRFDL